MLSIRELLHTSSWLILKFPGTASLNKSLPMEKAFVNLIIFFFSWNDILLFACDYLKVLLTVVEQHRWIWPWSRSEWTYRTQWWGSNDNKRKAGKGHERKSLVLTDKDLGMTGTANSTWKLNTAGTQSLLVRLVEFCIWCWAFQKERVPQERRDLGKAAISISALMRNSANCWVTPLFSLQYSHHELSSQQMLISVPTLQ